MASRNRGRKNPKISDLSRIPPTPEEIDALRNAVKQASPIATAILCAVMVEHELEALLRQRFPRIDDDTWLELLGERGPLDTFHRKILAAYAFRICDEATKHNLNINKNILNVFAHSKRLIDYDNHLIEKELLTIRIPSGRMAKNIRSWYRTAHQLKGGSKSTYINL